MDNWGKFDETTLNLENTCNEDYAHAQKVWEVFEIKNGGQYQNLYVKSDTFFSCRCVWKL